MIENKTFGPNPTSPERAPDREVRQVTHRDFESYLRLFNLPKELLTKTKTVVDIGAGFSDFSAQARQVTPGIRAIAVDPIYGLIKSDPSLTPQEFERREKVFLDFDPSYQGQPTPEDLSAHEREKDHSFQRFIKEVKQHPSEYIAASHQDLPLETQSVDLVLASNSIIRSKNEPPVIETALQECVRILKADGEIRIAGGMSCFVINETTGNIELWLTDLKHDGPWLQEFQQTGHYSNTELMRVFVDLEKMGIKFYGVVASGQGQWGGTAHRFDTLILRTDEGKPVITPSSEEITTELRKLQFQETDGFNIPSTKI